MNLVIGNRYPLWRDLGPRLHHPAGTSPPEGVALDSLNTLRAILVAFAFVAAIFLAVDGLWIPATVLGFGIFAHGLLWWHLYRTGQLPVQRSETPRDL